MEVFIESTCWDKIISYARSSYDQFKAEIGGMAIVHKKEDSFLVEEPVILKQIVSGGNCILDKDALAEYYVKTAMEHKDKKDLSFLWWHSHHTMGAFWSNTDLNAIEEMAAGKYSFSLVVNLKQEYKFRVSVWEPIEVHQDIEITRVYDMMDVDNEVKATCAKPEYTKVKSTYGGTGQLSMYHNTYGSSDQYTSKYPPYILVREVEELLKNTTLGKNDEKTLKKEITKLNKELKTKCDFRIAKLSVSQIKDCMYYIDARDIIYHKDEQFDFDELFDADYQNWNNSFGVI